MQPWVAPASLPASVERLRRFKSQSIADRCAKKSRVGLGSQSAVDHRRGRRLRSEDAGRDAGATELRMRMRLVVDDHQLIDGGLRVALRGGKRGVA